MAADSDDILLRLLALHPKRIDLSLRRVKRLAARLGDPQHHLPPLIHVAGTNGKGSFIAFLGAILSSAGYRVSRYTSPHLCNFRERIEFSDGVISDSNLGYYLEICETANDADAITFFEITTVAAFLAFAERQDDILLLETGLGGRLDATNIVAGALMGVITSVDIDHAEFLGGSLAEIAYEKAGIMKLSVPLLAALDSDSAVAVVQQQAQSLACPLFLYGRDFSVSSDGDIFRFMDRPPLAVARLSLLGRHQYVNAGLAFAAVQLLRDEGWVVTDSAVVQGMREAHWSARLQNLSASKLAGLLGERWDIYLDGGHNLAAARALLDFVKEWRQHDGGSLVVLLGMLNNKDALGFIEILACETDLLLGVEIPDNANSLAVSEILRFAEEAGVAAVGCANFLNAVEILQQHPQGGRLLICGSLYMAGYILKHFA